MIIKLKQRILLQAIDIHRHLVKELKIEFLKKEIRINSVDPAHYEMVITTIPMSACEKYNVKDKLDIGIDLKKLKDFLRLFKKDDVITFDYDYDTNRLLGKRGYLTRGLGLLDLAGWDSEKVPILELKNKLSVNAKIFHDGLKGVISNTNYEKTSLTVEKDAIILENYDEDEGNNKQHRSVVMQDTGAMKLDYCNPGDYTLFRSDLMIKQIKEYKKYFERITIETSPNNPLRITGSNDNLQVEYWIAPIIVETEDSEPEQKTEIEIDTKELKLEPEVEEPVQPEIYTSEGTKEDIERTIAKERLANKIQQLEETEIEKSIKPVVDMYADRLSIRKPKGLPYEKHQWTIDMEKIKNTLEKSLNKKNKKALSKITELQGFVFFKVNSTNKIKIDNNAGEDIIERLLPEGFVLIAWYRYRTDTWIAQTVEKVT